MNVRVVIPRRARNSEWREGLWRLVEPLWRATPWPLIVPAFEGNGPFNRSATIDLGASGDWDVMVVADADTIVPQSGVSAAIARAAETGGLVMPYENYSALTPSATRRFVGGEALAGTPRYTMRGFSTGGCMVIGRPAWEATGGFDKRFEGWGFEDRAFHIAANILGPVEAERVPGEVLHLWHPRSPERDPEAVEYERSLRLVNRYKAVRYLPHALRLVLQERGGPLFSSR